MRAAKLAQFLARPGLPPEDTAKVGGRASDAADQAGHALDLLTRLGAWPGAVPVSEPIPLELLDTPDAHELLALLRQAVTVAERLDRARGRALPADTELLPKETHGLDLAEAVAELALRVETEVYGPARTRGRE
jgi:hypothetical protein